MTFFEAFAWFCKQNKIYGDIMNIYNLTKPSRYDFKNHTQRLLSPKEWIEGIATSYRLSQIFSMMSMNGETVQYYKSLDKVKRKWKYFCDNNLMVDDSCVGKTITFIRDSNDRSRDIKYIVTSINKERFAANITCEIDNRNFNNYISLLYSDNDCYDNEGKKILFNFYIKKNKKLYGISEG